MRQPISLPQLLVVVRPPGLRALLGAQLMEEGYRVRPMATLEEALQRLQEFRVPPAMMIVDTLDQPLTLRALDELPVNLPLLVCTAPRDPAEPLLEQRPRTLILRKPFTPRELVDAVHKICYKGP